MASKLNYYSQMAEETARRLTSSYDQWTSFLRLAGRVNKYPYCDQLMIFAQRPEATACAEYDLWNNTMRRYVKRGAKGIALIDNSGDYPRLRYIFDVADTGTRANSRPVNRWELQDEYKEPVQKSLAATFQVSSQDALDVQFENIANWLAIDYWQEHGQELAGIVADSFLEGYDEDNRRMSFLNAAAVSIKYELLSRCVADPEAYFDPEEFVPVFDYNTRSAANALGTAVSENASRVLREIERTIRACERRKAMERSTHHEERTDLHEARGLPDSRPDLEGDQPGAAGQVRADAPGLSEGTPPDSLQRPGADGAALFPSAGDRRDGPPEGGAVDGRAAGAEPLAGQENRPDGLGTAHERTEGPGGGGSSGGTYQQLSLDDLIPSEAEQITVIDHAAESTMPSAVFFAQSDIDHVLRLGGSRDRRMEIAAQYSRQKPLAEIARYLSSAYHGGLGLLTDHGRLSAWFSEDGIHLANGDAARYIPSAQCISWENAAQRIGELLDAGQFATNVELAESQSHSRALTAQSLWYLRHDFSKDAEDKGLFSVFDQYRGGGFPDETARGAEALADPAVLTAVTTEAERFAEAYKADRSLLRFHYHKLPVILDNLHDLARPWQEYTTEMAEVPQTGHFISQDEIDEALTYGSLMAGGKGRIYAYFSGDHTAKEKADFLREEYGTGGHSDALSNDPYSLEDFDFHGIKLKKSDCPEVKLSWSAAAKRVDYLVAAGRYLTAEEQAQLEQRREATDIPTADEPEDDSFFDVDPAEIRARLEKRGIVNGMVVDPEKLAQDPFIQQVEADVARIAAEADGEEITGSEPEIVPITPPTHTPDAPAVDQRDYCVGDTLYLDGKPFVIEHVGLFDVRLRDPDLDYPIFRAESKENLARLLERKDNIHLHNLVVELNPPQAEREEPAKELPPAQNFRITDDRLGEGGPKQKYARNVAAIRTLLTLEAERRNATPEEQEVLSRYVGWGSLADAFDPNKPAWAQEYRELKELLSEEEYAAARASTLNAHYTSPTVIRAIYDAVGKMGFETGNILEPSMGVGNFFGLLPEAMQGSRLYGVELDSITGRIAQKLYPKADIKVTGFETTDRRDFYDLAVGNVPFGDYRVNDKPYNKLGFSIHNYFFAKALDQVRPGGVVAFVTSRYTMDAKSPEVRKYLAQRAELLGAIRLPNNAFRANAGTDVVSDILFLQKRETPIDIEPDWVHLGQTPEGLGINSYFIDHPEMVLGELTTESTQYGREECTVVPIPGADLAEQLQEAVSHIQGSYVPAEIAPEELEDAGAEVIPADPGVKNYSFVAVNGEVYFRENSVMRRVDTNDMTKQRILGMIGLRQIVNELIAYQLEDYPDEAIQEKQQGLDAAYDAFTEKYGLLNARPNANAFGDDSSYYLLCSLENVDEEGNLLSKADMFTKRTIRPDRSVTSVDTPVEALAVSIGEQGRIDLPFMAQLMGTPGEYERIISDLTGVIFRDPYEASAEDITKGWHTADDYLSGNVRAKLTAARLAAKSDPAFLPNVQALEQAQPKDLDASEIDVRLGATWIDPDYIQQFMEETFEPPFYLRRSIQVHFSPLTAEWQITGKSVPSHHDVAAYVTYGTDRSNAYRILEETLNLKDIRIYDTVEDADGKQKRVLNRKETTLAQQKQQAIKDAFQDWVWRDPRRRAVLCQKYNELFNSTRPREYDGSHIHFVGMNPEIALREHQRNAIAHILYGGNTLLAHEVGAGKTFSMAAAAMESKRLGLCQKSLFVVPNHLTLQWANEFLRLYPSAKLLVASKRDFETARRKKFCARIATGDYDAIIIGHSQFEKIPVSAERQERLLQEQIEEIEAAIESMKMQRGENFTIKQMEKTRRSLQAKLDKLTSTERKDDVVTFEQLGVDRLFVDESHSYKNLFLYTKMRNVAGLSTSEAQKSSDMFMKCRYLDELTGGRGVVFATGTPVSNSMTELYTVMRYLQYSTLQRMGLTHFDCWASTFGETTTAIELAPEGTGYRARTRFAKFFNLPELMNLFKEAADIKTSDQLHLPVPEAQFETVVVQPSEYQKKMVQELSKRAARVHAGTVDASEDNMLCITSDGRKIGLDQRLMNPLLPDDPSSKVNACVNNVFRIWQEGTPEKLTQLLFCDMSTPKTDGSFNVYDDIRSKLEAMGVPHEEIAFIHDADNEAKKKELFAKVRSGQVRVLLGSTQKMGAGTNCQDLLVAIHHLDVGWRPADMTQRNGRIIRQGNRNKQVQIYQYVTEGTFDAYLYQTLENKQKFISQIMTSKSPVRSCDDVDEQVLSYAEIKALCAGSPLIKEKMDLDIDVARLKVLKADYRSKQYRLEDQLLKYFPQEIESQQSSIRGFQQDIATVEAHPHPTDGFAGMTVAGRTYTEKTDAGEAILAVCKSANAVEGYPLGSYRGFQMELSYDSFEKQFCISLKGSMTHKVFLGSDARGNLIRLDNALSNIPARLEQAQARLETLEQQQSAARAEAGKPFPQEAELAEKSARLAELDAALNMEGNNDTVSQDEEARPSVLADLRQKAGQVSPPRRDSGRRAEEVL